MTDVVRPDGDVGDLGGLADEIRGQFRTAEEMSTAFIREAILRGVFRPGEKLNQDQIARSLSISRIPVRSSLRHLEAERLVSFHPFRGASVHQLTEEDVDEVYELRAVLECLALDYAAPNLTEEVLTDLQAEAGQLDHPSEGVARLVTDRRNFFRRLYEYSGRSRLVELIDMLRREAGPYLAISGLSGEHTGHQHLLTLLLDGDLEVAKEWLRGHLGEVAEGVKALVRQDEGRA